MLKYWGVLVLSIIFVLSSAGCNKMGNNGVKPNEYKARSNESLVIKERAHPSSNKQVSEKISRNVSSIKGISKATVIVYNRDAIIGIDIKKGENTATVEQKVRQVVQHSEPGYNVHVTTDKKHHTRIESIHKQMVPLDGHPIRNFSEDVRILIQDIGRKVTAPTR